MEKVDFIREKITLQNVSDYFELIDSIRYICDFNGYDKNFDITDDIREPALPPGGILENNYITGFRLKETLQPCVWTSWYEHFSNNETVFLGELYVNQKLQKRGIGSSVFQILENEWKKNGIKRIVLNVDLKNTAAILFWVKMGFKTIDFSFDTKMGGEGKYYMLRLSKNI